MVDCALLTAVDAANLNCRGVCGTWVPQGEWLCKYNRAVGHWLTRPLSTRSCSDKSAEPASVERFVLHQLLLKVIYVVRKPASQISECCAACNTVHTGAAPQYFSNHLCQ